MMLKPLNQFILKSAVVCAAVIAAAFPSSAQVNFSVSPVRVEGGITEEAATVVYDKTVQILTRNSASASGAVDVFTVEPALSVTGQSQTSGLVRDISTVSGELVLVARNKVDGARYYSVTVPLKAASKSGNSDAVLALANSIKPTDAVFTRFVRVAREKVDEYYSDHCSEVLGRAQTLAASGQTALAMIYLTGVPASAPCHEESVEYIAALRGKIDDDIAKEEAKREAKEERDWQRWKEMNSNPENAPGGNTPALSQRPSPAGNYGIFIEDPNWKFTVVKAEYLPTARKIKITASIEYVGKKSLSGECALGFRQAVDEEGDNYERCYVEGSKYRSFPDGIPVKVEYFIEDVKTNPGILQFVGLSVDYKKIEIRNLPLSL